MLHYYAVKYQDANGDFSIPGYAESVNVYAPGTVVNDLLIEFEFSSKPQF